MNKQKYKYKMNIQTQKAKGMFTSIITNLLPQETMECGEEKPLFFTNKQNL